MADDIQLQLPIPSTDPDVVGTPAVASAAAIGDTDRRLGFTEAGEPYSATVAQEREALAPPKLKGTVAPTIALPGRKGQEYSHIKADNSIDEYQHDGTDWQLWRQWGAQNISTGLSTNAAPTVSLRLSTASITLGQAVTLTADAFDSDGTISKVEFYEGNTKINERLTPPYSYTYTPEDAGYKTLLAVATDNAGLSRQSAPQEVEVKAVGNQLPAVSLVASSALVGLGTQVTLTATASDPDGSVDSVEFYFNATLIGKVATAPYVLAFAPTIVGKHTLSAKAIDNRGGSRTTAGLPLEVQSVLGNPTTPPTVSLAVSQNPVTSGTPVTLSAVASAQGTATVVKVEFFAGDTSLGEDNSAPFAYSYTPTATAETTLLLYAKATDSTGLSTTTGGLALQVKPAAAAPVTPAAPTFANFADTQEGGSVTVVPGAGVPMSLVQVLLPGAIGYTAAPAGGVVTVGNVAGSVLARSIAGQGFAASPVATSPAFTSYTPPANQLPVVTSFAASATAVTAGATVTFTAAATDPDGTVQSIRVYEGGALVATIAGASGSQASPALAAGSHTYTAKAYDGTAEGNAFGTSVSVLAEYPFPLTGPSAGDASGVTLTTDGQADVLRFTQIASPGNTDPKRMDLSVGGAGVAAVDFPASYLGQGFSYTRSGTRYEGVFTDGPVPL